MLIDFHARKHGTPLPEAQVIAYIGRKNIVIAAGADASLRAWEMVNKTFKEAPNGHHPQMGVGSILGLPTT